ncbi:PIN domain-containing protein [Sandaracinobacteroides saxicola]|uniref:Ribonuclease VapC n=1 Tax=Sandaracinobacteroides saxicola TaxID=2759707 RepID=A0A7G5II13_9SPHN|nr:PIN domain-containing protein [Sandaracinobacteroides saxicola]QMW23005.1 PIN domain-containing protein [Sandaracinobacteroides saxicola]
MILLDTSAAIPIRDAHPAILLRAAEWTVASISVVTEIELEGGVVSDPAQSSRRRARLDLLLTQVRVLPFQRDAVRVYRAIVEASGFSRRKVIDCMIAATAIVHDLPLATLNPGDFKDIPGLSVENWGVS